jgi:segregation and condensation protein B
MELTRILEAILFISPKPVTLKVLQKKLEGFTQKDIESALGGLMREYNYSERAVEIIQVSGGYQMRTRSDFKDWVKIFAREKDVVLTRSMLETLAVVAYRQPVTKAEIDRVRGVDSIRSIKHLLERRLIEMAGRDGEIGLQMTFRTTNKFLEAYSLNTIKDLPTLKEIEALKE